MSDQKIDAAHRHLIDRELIDQAVSAHQAAVARLAQAEGELTAANVVHTAAQQASEAAVAGQGAVTPMNAEIALEAAARALAVGMKVRDAAASAVTSAAAGIDTAGGEAHLRMYRAGIAARLSAAKRADAARAELAAAQQAHVAATEMLNAATRAGTQHVIYDPAHGAGSPVGTYEAELARWSRPNGWWSGEPLALVREAV